MAPTGIYLGLLVYGAGVLLLSMLGALGYGHDDAHDAGHDDAHDAGHDDAGPGATGRPCRP